MPLLSTDPTDLLCDENGQLVVDSDAYLCGGVDGVAQAIRIAVLLVRGEWFLNLLLGMPLFENDAGQVTADQAILGGHFNQVAIELAYRQAISKVNGVDSIRSVTATYDGHTRGLDVAWEVVTAFGDTITDRLAVP